MLGKRKPNLYFSAVKDKLTFYTLMYHALPSATQDNSNTDSINYFVNITGKSGIECLLPALVIYMLVRYIHNLKNTQNFSAISIFSFV